MKSAYPVILKREDKGFLVEIPGFEINTYGKSVVEAIEMARDAIGLAGIDRQDHGEKLPVPLSLEDVKAIGCEEVISYVDVDFLQYRNEIENALVKKNCTIPRKMSLQAEEAGINFSEVLRQGIQEKLDSLNT